MSSPRLVLRRPLRLAAALVAAITVAGTLSAPASGTAAAAAPVTDVDALAQAHRTGAPVEVTAATTPTDTLTANPNGTLTIKRHAIPIRKKVGGAWKGLDTTLRDNGKGAILPAVTSGELAFSAGGPGPLATMRSAGSQLALSVPVPLPRPVLAGATATYLNVLPGVDLEVTATTQGGFTQVFTVHNAAAAANPALKTLTMAVSANELTIAADAAGGISAADRLGRKVFTAAAPVMWDSNTSSGAVAGAGAGRALSSNADGPGATAKVVPVGVKVIPGAIVLEPDAGMLASPATVFPVFIDPSWTPVKPTMSGNRKGYASAAKAYPTSNRWNATTDPNPDNLQLGWNNDGWHARTMVNFDIDISKLAGAVISDAHIDVTSVYSGSCTAAKTRVFAPTTTLTSSNATWNYWYNTVNLGSVIGSNTFSGGYSSSCPAKSIPFDVKTGVQKAVTEGRSVQTFVFTGDTNETSDTASYKELSLASLAMAITYNRTPSTPSNLTTSPQTQCTGQVSTVGDGTVLLYAQVSDPDGGKVGVRYEAWKSTVPGTLIASTDPTTYPISSGGTAVLTLDQTLLRNQAAGAVTEFSWRVQVWDGYATSGWSPTCKFSFDPTRPGAPSAQAPADGTTHIGQEVEIGVTKPSGGATPTSYRYQLNTSPPLSVQADPNTGNATIKIKPTRRTNTLTISSLSQGGNPSAEAARITFTTAPLAPDAADGDLNGDGAADLFTIGNINGLPPGAWLAPGRNNGQVNTIAGNIGVNGTGLTSALTPTVFNGAQIITGLFTDNGFQDILVYYPGNTGAGAQGSGSIIVGTGDGSALQPQLSENQFTITSTDLLEEDDQQVKIPASWPIQIANAGDAAGNDDEYADLIGIAGVSGNRHLSYYYYSSILSLQSVTPLTTQTPAGDSNWDQWRIATAQVKVGSEFKTDMFLWKPATGALHLWRDLQLSSSGELTFSAQQLAASDWHTNAVLNLQATDANSDGWPDLWATANDGTITPYVTSPGTITKLNPQTLSTAVHTWALNNMGSASSGDTVSSATDNPAPGTSAKNLSGSTGATWQTGELYSPSIKLNGSTGMLVTSGSALNTNADFTVSAWVNPAATAGTVLAQDGSNIAGFKLFADGTDKSWQFALSRSDSTTATWDVAKSAANTVEIGVWTQLTASFKALTGTMNLAINGTTVATSSHTTMWNATGALRIGAAKASGSTYDSFLSGQLANIQVWHQVTDIKGASRSFMSDARADIIRNDNGTLKAYFNGGITGSKSVNWDCPASGYTIGDGLNTAGTSLYFADLSGDGKRDLIRKDSSGNLYAHYNDGGDWATTSTSYLVGSGWTEAASSIYFADLDGNGFDDIVRKSNGNLEVYYNRGLTVGKQIIWDQASSTNGYAIGNGWTMDDSSIYFADLTGEGRADIIRKHVDGKLGAYYNEGINSSKGVSWDYASGGYSIGSSWTMPDSSIYFADLTGEGRADIVRKDTGSLNAYYNTGRNASKAVIWDYGSSGYPVAPGWSIYPNASVHIG